MRGSRRCALPWLLAATCKMQYSLANVAMVFMIYRHVISLKVRRKKTRNNWVRDQQICFRCLHPGHWVTKCKSSNICGQCSRVHHSLLHSERSAVLSGQESTSREGRSDIATSSSCLGHNTLPSVILGTALIHMPDSIGVIYTVRVLIDSASQISAITSECKDRLELRM